MLNLLIHKILSLAMIVAVGFFLVRFGPLESRDTKGLSRLNCYLIMPCSIFGAFQMNRSPEILRGLSYVLLGAAPGRSCGPGGEGQEAPPAAEGREGA